MLSHSHSRPVGCFYPIENTIILASIPLWNTNIEKTIADPALVRVSKSTPTRLGQRSIQVSLPELLEVINKGLNKSLCDNKQNCTPFVSGQEGKKSMAVSIYATKAKRKLWLHLEPHAGITDYGCGCTNALHMMAPHALR
jgi:hypothetical protein